MSYNMTWQYLRMLVQEMAKVNWLWSYDNFNIHRHERQGILRSKIPYKQKLITVLTTTVDHHNKMENTTTRLAVQIEKHPPFPFSWDDKSPQKSQSELKEEDIISNEDDGHHLYQRMLNFMMEFLVQECKCPSDLRQFLPAKQHPTVHRSVVLPMKLLFRDEKYTDENIQIILQ